MASLHHFTEPLTVNQNFLASHWDKKTKDLYCGISTLCSFVFSIEQNVSVTARMRAGLASHWDKKTKDLCYGISTLCSFVFSIGQNVSVTARMRTGFRALSWFHTECHLSHSIVCVCLFVCLHLGARLTKLLEISSKKDLITKRNS